jgi:hypothetical protein
MSLILGRNGIQKLMAGYPTVSDKCDVAPATLESGVASNGSVMMHGTAHSLYKVASSVATAEQVAGVLLATNVKVPGTYPAATGSVETKAGEQFGLIVRGFVAVELDAGADLAAATEGSTVHITAAGKLTTSTASTVALTWRFTGVTETQGTAKLAEVEIR